MSSNTIHIQVEFSFRGETYTLAETIDLDSLSFELGRVEDSGMPDLHRRLALGAGIDPISYMYEVLESHDITFTEATGLAVDYCHDGAFDWHGFAKAQWEEGDWRRILSIVQERIELSVLETDPVLRDAFMAVYRAGKADARKQVN